MQNGMNPDQIIVMAVDDIANYASNPFPGKVFNKPSDIGDAGVDVYEGCAIDYSGALVTPETFKKVLLGDADGLNGGKVLQSTKNDRVFVNFVDHGGVNLIGFPKSTMHAMELVEILQQMSTAGMFKELVFYLEACESGSMFRTLPSDIRVYASSAANAHESSWGTYCMPEDKVNGKHIGSCLGDLYSVSWMEDSDHGNPGETIEEQMDTVIDLTTKSHVTLFGDQTIADEPITSFEGAADGRASNRLPPPRGTDTQREAAIRSEDAALTSAFYRFITNDDDLAADELIDGVQQRRKAKRRFDAITRTLTGDGLDSVPPRTAGVDDACHYAAHQAYVAHCGDWHEMALSFSSTLADLCELEGGRAERLVDAIEAACV